MTEGRLIKRILNKARWVLGGSSENFVFPSLDATIGYLAEWGFRPSHVIDVGAYHGEWARTFKSHFPNARILMIEAQEKKEGILREVANQFPSEVEYSISLLGSMDDEIVRFSEMETGSSVLEESSPYPREYVEKRQTTLDSLVKNFPGFECCDFLKLDVQGYELEVLKGAGDLLGETEFVLLETSLVQINQGCPLFAEVISFMDEADFRLLDFCSQIRRRDGALWQTDLLFISNASKFVPNAKLTKENWG